MEHKHQPLFECESCGYQDFMGNTNSCPVCNPDENAEENICFFVNLSDSTCRQDGKECPHIEDKSWEVCKKLEGYNPRLGRE